MTYSQQEQSLIEGLAMTFDGDHPCGMCDAIQAGQERNADQDDPTAPLNQKEIKLTQIFAATVDWALPQYPPATFGRHPSRLGEPWSLALSPFEKPPQMV